MKNADKTPDRVDKDKEEEEDETFKGVTTVDNIDDDSKKRRAIIEKQRQVEMLKTALENRLRQRLTGESET